MNNLINAVWHQDGMISVDNLFGSAFTSEDGGHTFQIRGVDGAGEPLSLGGTITATFIRPDGTTVALNGTNPDGVATVTLTDDCYAVPGYFGMTIFMTLSGQTTCIYACAGNIVSSSTGSVAPTASVDVVDLINAIAEAVASIPADYSDMYGLLAPAYSSSSTYKVGQLVTYNQKIYRCTTAITTAEAWTSGHWTEDSIGNAFNLRAFTYVRTTSSSDDLDTFRQMGIYYWSSSGIPIHAPTNNNYILLVFRRTDTSLVQICFPNGNQNTRIWFRTYNSGSSSWFDWVQIPFRGDVDNIAASLRAAIAEIESNVYFPYTAFENGNINSSGQPTKANMHPIRTGFIAIDEFVSVDVTGDDGSGNNYVYQLFAYDANYGYLGFGLTHHAEPSTRADVLAAYPTTKYVRIKVSGGDDSGPNLDPADLDDYGYTGLVRISYKTVQQAAAGGQVDVLSMIESQADEDGTYTDSFALEFDLGSAPKILSISASYTGSTAPTIQIKSLNSNNISILNSPVYTLGGTVEPTRRSWRIPPRSGPYTRGHVDVTIPSGTTVTIQSAEMREDQRNRYGTDGILWHGHAGYLAPEHTVEAFQRAAELGYNSLVTIPKITSDGTPICFHDDSSISGDLCWMDGTAISGTYDKAISEYSYSYITENFRVKSLAWGVLHVPKVDDYFRVCSLTGMKPIFSVHSTPSGMWTGSAGQANFQKLRTLAEKWRVLGGIGIKSGSSSILAAARAVFGTDIGCYIIINGQTHAPADQLGICKDAGLVEQSATDLSGCPYRIVSEYFYGQTVSGATYYSQTMAMMETAAAQGFRLSVACTGYNPSGAELERLIGIGVTEFTVDNHISMGLCW